MDTDVHEKIGDTGGVVSLLLTVFLEPGITDEADGTRIEANGLKDDRSDQRAQGRQIQWSVGSMTVDPALVGSRVVDPVAAGAGPSATGSRMVDLTPAGSSRRGRRRARRGVRRERAAGGGRRGGGASGSSW